MGGVGWGGDWVCELLDGWGGVGWGLGMRAQSYLLLVIHYVIQSPATNWTFWVFIVCIETKYLKETQAWFGNIKIEKKFKMMFLIYQVGFLYGTNCTQNTFNLRVTFGLSFHFVATIFLSSLWSRKKAGSDLRAYWRYTGFGSYTKLSSDVDTIAFPMASC